ncbi:MAG: hypothetical protein V4760_15265, partial [Bdellovibrionota bacterium]
ELRTKTTIAQARKKELITMIDSQSCEKVDRVIAIEFPNLDLEKKESVKPVNATETKFTLIVSEEDLKTLTRMREVASHAHFNASWSELFVVAAKEYLKRHDPLLKTSKKKDEKPGLEAPLSQPRTAARKALSRTDALRATQISRSSEGFRANMIEESSASGASFDLKEESFAPELKDSKLQNGSASV